MKETTEKHTGVWWKATAVYQVYPRSFQDSNNDGIGDIQGIISRLDYIKNLGLETIWFSPFFESPQQDFGYDISDFTSIASEYGDMDSVQRLIDEIHTRDMKIILDMVMNHTSEKHPWFRESCSSRENPKRDWYIWRDGRKPGGQAPPNNWKSVVAGRGWHYHRETDQWYWASFLPFQPDLNYRNPAVKKTMLDIVRFWLERGVDGFRLDIFDALFKDADFRNNPAGLPLNRTPENESLLFQKRTRTCHHPDTFAFAKELRAVVDEYDDPPRFLVGEVSGTYDILREYCGGEEPDGLHTVFLFKALSAQMKADVFRTLIEEFEEHFPEPFFPTWVFSNHDRIRRFSFIGEDEQQAKLNAALQFTVRGVPFTYYGEEIGMSQAEIPFEEALDPVARRFSSLPRFFNNLLNRVTHGAANRDGCRTPMQWNDSPHAGFCTETADPWLPVNSDYLTKNVNAGKLKPDSLYNCYRRFLTARNENPALQTGELELIPENDLPKQVLGYKRFFQDDSEQFFVFLNFSREPQTVSVSVQNPALIVSTIANEKTEFVKKDKNSVTFSLGPYEGIVIRETIS